MADATPALAMRGVRKSYGAVEVLHGVDLDVAHGEFVALIGPSGCGKSTLLRMIAGLETVSAGTLSLDGDVVNERPPKDRDIAMVFQNYALYPHMTVAQNMGFSLRLKRAKKAEFDAAVKKAAEILGLEALLDRYPGQLSGGQRQRVAMGRAIVRDPALFLFDEPLSNLDAKLRVQMRIEIKALHDRLKSTTIYVTHDQAEAMTMADRIVVMRSGHIEQAGSPLDLYDEPANRFVADFLGSPAMNVLEGEVVDGRFHYGSGLAMDMPRPGVTGRIGLGFRPEHVAITGDGIPGQIAAVEPMGSDTHLVARVDTQTVNIVVHDRVALRTGDPVHLTVDPARLHVFAEDGRRI
ncbi:MAG: sn-glycerol-3-phosphate ABC transporter ATP-binding protein UgpC [Acuticoccus sp.]